MRNFFGNFAQFGGFFLFLLLESICFFLVVTYNQEQRVILEHSTNLLNGAVLKTTQSARNYLNLEEIADSLALENARLMEDLTQRRSLWLEDSDSTLTFFKSDSAYRDLFEIVPARVINNSINKHHNYLTLDIGSQQGVMPHVGVITPSGLVGIVRRVSPHYCRVMSILHRQTRVSVGIRRNGFYGTLFWRGNDPRIMQMEDVPKHADLVLGDTVITSGYSNIFPPGMFVGTVRDFSVEPGSNSYKIEVLLGQDLSKLPMAYIVKNLRKAEIDQIETSLEDE